MRHISDNKNSESNIIPFKNYKKKSHNNITSTIAAILAVKISHPYDTNPEDFFINEINNFDEIEILAFEDALNNGAIGVTTKEAQNDSINDA